MLVKAKYNIKLGELNIMVGEEVHLEDKDATHLLTVGSVVEAEPQVVVIEPVEEIEEEEYTE